MNAQHRINLFLSYSFLNCIGTSLSYVSRNFQLLGIQSDIRKQLCHSKNDILDGIFHHVTNPVRLLEIKLEIKLLDQCAEYVYYMALFWYRYSNLWRYSVHCIGFVFLTWNICLLQYLRQNLSKVIKNVAKAMLKWRISFLIDQNNLIGK